MDREQGCKPAWAAFDRKWYREQYQQALQEIAGDIPDDDLESFWRERGGAYGHAPNRYFDELFYRRNNPSVGEGIHRGIFISGYQHYEEIGYQGCAPHWLFDESAYFGQNPDLTINVLKDAGLENGYDHYIAHGQKEQRVSNPFFDPDVLRVSLFQARLAYFSPEGEFTRALTDPEVGALRCSWYFDPDWYLETYPQVRAMIKPGVYYSALHHYLSNDTPSSFDPNPHFSESWYQAAYPDVAAELGRGMFRNGYAHFMRFGLKEGRKPFENAMLATQDIDTPRDNAFITYVKGEGASPPIEVQDLPPSALATLRVRRVAVTFAQLARTPLDFSSAIECALSVVIPFENDCSALVETLVSLHGARAFGLQVILVDLAGHQFLTQLERWAKGVTILREDGAYPLHVRTRVAETVSAQHVLFLDPGMTLVDPTAVRLSEKLEKDSEIAALVPLTLDETGKVKDAGADLWKQGDVALVGAGLAAHDPALRYQRTCDTFIRNAFICRASDLAELSLDDVYLSAHGYFAALGLTLRRITSRRKSVYMPGFVVQDYCSDRQEQGFVDPDRRLILKRFGDLCQQRPFKADRPTRFSAEDFSSKRCVLIITRDLPQGKALGDQLRLVAVAQDMVALGMHVSIFSLHEPASPVHQIHQFFDETVGIFHSDAAQTLSDFLTISHGYFDFIWVNGVSSVPNLGAAFTAARDALPLTGYLLDARGHGLEDGSRRLPSIDAPDGWMQVSTSTADFSEAWMFQRAILSNERDRQTLAQRDLERTVVLGGRRACGQSEGFENRINLVFALPVLQEGDIGYRALLWTLTHVMPRVSKRLDVDVRLVVSTSPETAACLASLRYYAGLCAPIKGYEPIELLCDRARLMIDPTDATSGLTAAAEMALSRGLPLIAAGEGTEAGVIYASNTPELFAEAIATLYDNAEAWEVYSEYAREGGADQAKALSQMREVLSSAKVIGGGG